MRPIRFVGLGVLLALLVVPAFAQDKVDVRTMKYDDLAKLIRDNRGKVVVVDVWFYACKPCKEEGIPNLVKLHEKYSKAGLVAVTVQVDENPKDREKGAKWLRDNKVPAINVTLDESMELANASSRVSGWVGDSLLIRTVRRLKPVHEGLSGNADNLTSTAPSTAPN